MNSKDIENINKKSRMIKIYYVFYLLLNYSFFSGAQMIENESMQIS